ncbi:uncharacterized protein C2orf74 homolog [Saccopteryx leptura]|uniref:uncharacterized protein C2orf74 homolog n=1 Tax=Saccopteryx leptura TaxID=249018 RepID=UPI00339D1CA8
MSFATAAVPFFVLIICFICIFLLLMVVVHKCFQNKESDETEKDPCEDCLGANIETSNLEDRERTLMRQIIRPGILVHRQSKEMVATPLNNEEDIEDKVEDKTEEKEDPEKAQKNHQENDDLQKPHIPVTGTPSVMDNSKKPLKGVTFSREVIVVDIGKEYPTRQSHIHERRERK